MIQAKLIGLVLKALFKSDIFQGLIKYKDEDNELDIKVRDLENNITDIGFKHTAVIDMVKGYSETIDNVEQNVKSIDKVIKKVESKIKQIDKIAHPPAIPLKEINEFRAMKDEFKGVKKIIDKMKKVSLLKSVFK